MNSITVFLTIACLAGGVALGAAGYLYLGVPVVILAIVIASRRDGLSRAPYQQTTIQ